MNLNNQYNFKNTIRHFIDISSLNFPIVDGDNAFSIEELSWTEPISFRVLKEGDKYRTLKLPNILSFVRAYHYYKDIPNFEDLGTLGSGRRRLTVNLKTGDFITGEYDSQIEDDLMKLCLYDSLLNVDIREYYGKIYTHHLNFELSDGTELADKVLAGLNSGRTGGILMGNYLSLFFAESMLDEISSQIENRFNEEDLKVEFNYFSDNFYFFFNNEDKDLIISIFDEVLERNDFNRNEQKNEVWNYETYNSYNILTRYWKSIVRHWNEENIKFDKRNEESDDEIPYRLTFLNRIIYRVSELIDNKSKRILVNNFFKSEHFQTSVYNNYEARPYNYHQFCYLMKLSPEALLYTSYLFSNWVGFDNSKIEAFLGSRYSESLNRSLHDEQLYYYFALKCYGFDEIVRNASEEVLNSGNQILISYYLKDNLFVSELLDRLKEKTEEQYWFQNYHLILYSQDLLDDLETNIEKYLLPKNTLDSQKTAVLQRKARYLSFYEENLNDHKSIIVDIPFVIANIRHYLEARWEETKLLWEESQQ